MAINQTNNVDIYLWQLANYIVQEKRQKQGGEIKPEEWAKEICEVYKILNETQSSVKATQFLTGWPG